MKKLISLALAFVMCLGLAACGGNAAPAGNINDIAPATTAPAPAPVAEPVVEEEGVDEELIAVIAAAIAAFDQTGAKLVVRSVRRKGAWGKASREEQVYRF